MKILRCIVCNGEVDVLDGDKSVNKTVKCRCCGFTNSQIYKRKEPEVLIIRRQPME